MKQCIALAVFGLFSVAAAQGLKSPKEISRLGPSFVLDYVSLLQDSLPAIHSSSDCFTYYMPLLSTLANETEVKSEACNSTAAADMALAIAIVQTENNDLSDNTNSVINVLQECSTITDSLQQLECYSFLVSTIFI